MPDPDPSDPDPSDPDVPVRTSRTVVVPGSFDPPHLGHLDVITRAAALFADVVVTVLHNPAKQGLFDVAQRREMLTEITADLPGVRVDAYAGLLVEHCRDVGAVAVVKGVRGGGDVDHEQSMAQMNRHLTGLDTLLLVTDPRHAFLSSSLIKQVAGLGGDVAALLPPTVHRRLLDRLGGPDGA